MNTQYYSVKNQYQDCFTFLLSSYQRRRKMGFGDNLFPFQSNSVINTYNTQKQKILINQQKSVNKLRQPFEDFNRNIVSVYDWEDSKLFETNFCQYENHQQNNRKIKNYLMMRPLLLNQNQDANILNACYIDAGNSFIQKLKQNILEEFHNNICQNQIVKEKQTQQIGQLNQSTERNQQSNIWKEVQIHNKTQDKYIQAQSTKTGEEYNKPQLQQKQKKIADQNDNKIFDSQNKPNANYIDYQSKRNYYDEYLPKQGSVKKYNNQVNQQYFGKSKCGKKFTYMVAIDRLERGIWLGVIDKRLKQKQQLINQKNWIYLSNEGYLWNGSQQIKIREENESQNTINSNQTIIVTIDSEKDRIVWKCGYRILCECHITALTDSTIEWIPYVYSDNRTRTRSSLDHCQNK